MARKFLAARPAAGGWVSRERIAASANGAVTRTRFVAAMATAAVALAASFPVAAWNRQPVEFIVPAGTGGGADQMARLLQGVIQKNNLMKQPMIVVNKPAAPAPRVPRGQGCEGRSQQDHHHAVEPVHDAARDGCAFQLEGSDPVAMLALDQFVLWVNAETPYKTAKDYLDAVKAGGPNKFKMGGTGSKQEDQIITVAIEKATGTKFTYIPFKGGGDVAVQLVGKHIDSSVNNLIEAVAQWRAGALRPLCVFDDTPMPYKTKVTDTMSWSDIPPCKAAGSASTI